MNISRHILPLIALNIAICSVYITNTSELSESCKLSTSLIKIQEHLNAFTIDNIDYQTKKYDTLLNITLKDINSNYTLEANYIYKQPQTMFTKHFGTHHHITREILKEAIMVTHYYSPDTCPNLYEQINTRAQNNNKKFDRAAYRSARNFLMTNNYSQQQKFLMLGFLCFLQGFYTTDMRSLLIGLCLIPHSTYQMSQIAQYQEEFEKWERYEQRNVLPEDTPLYAMLKSLNERNSEKLQILQELVTNNTPTIVRY